tara:strand:- start:320 stop:925 length:606 start_codon:yes stop_codon:yes gene_type:complete
MKRQFNTFIGGEASAWLKRNKKKIDKKNDPVLHAIKQHSIKPTAVLEVGCADGWRLRELMKKYKCMARGIDPCHDLKPPMIHLGGAHDLKSMGECASFDLVIYGFCLYLCDREDLFKIASEGDRVLLDGGHLVVYDFFSRKAQKFPYSHKEGIFSYHFDYSKLWSWNPSYRVVQRGSYNVSGALAEVTILQKKVSGAWVQK